MRLIPNSQHTQSVNIMTSSINQQAKALTKTMAKLWNQGNQSGLSWCLNGISYAIKGIRLKIQYYTRFNLKYKFKIII